MSKDKSSKNKSKNKKEAEVQISKSYASSNSSDTTTAFSFKRLVNDYFTMNNMWIYLVIITVVFLIFFQYKYEMAERASSGMEDSEVNYYEILDIDSSADLATIRKKYKDLAKIWHPDKHQDCKICKEKFALISKAYEVLSDDAKKGDYDHRSGKSIFSSEPITLTEANYHRLVEESNEFWIIVVYENRTKDRFLQSFADVFDEVALKYRNIIKFGAIDVLRHEGLLKYLPYNFPIIPSIYTFRNGEDCEIFPNIDEFSVKGKISYNLISLC